MGYRVGPGKGQVSQQVLEGHSIELESAFFSRRTDPGQRRVLRRPSSSVEPRSENLDWQVRERWLRFFGLLAGRQDLDRWWFWFNDQSVVSGKRSRNWPACWP